MNINYLHIFILLAISTSLSILIYFVSFLIISKKTDVEKLTAYECGFNPYDDAKKVFDVRFYLIAILFIVFDIESVFIFPWVMTLDCNFAIGFWSMMEFLSELIVGYIYVWYIGALDWS